MGKVLHVGKNWMKNLYLQQDHKLMIYLMVSKFINKKTQVNMKVCKQIVKELDLDFNNGFLETNNQDNGMKDRGRDTESICKKVVIIKRETGTMFEMVQADSFGVN